MSVNEYNYASRLMPGPRPVWAWVQLRHCLAIYAGSSSFSSLMISLRLKRGMSSMNQDL